MATKLTAATEAQLNADIADATAATSGSYEIDLLGDIIETVDPTAIDLQSGVTLIVDGSNGSGGTFTLDGAGTYSGLLVDAGGASSAATIENLDISNVPSTQPATLSSGTLSGSVTISSDATVDQTADLTLGDTNGPATVTNDGVYEIDQLTVGTGPSGPYGEFYGPAIDGVAGSLFINNGTLIKLANPADFSGVSEIYVDVTDTGTLSVPDTGSNLRFTGSINSFSGTYIGGGMIDYGDPATFQTLGNSNYSINTLGTLDMSEGACTTSWATVNQEGQVTVSASTSITDFGTWNFTSDAGLTLEDPSAASFSGAEFALYRGTLAKIGGTGTTVIGIDFNEYGGAFSHSYGYINIASGTLAFDGLIGNFYSIISGNGTFSLGGGGTDNLYDGTAISTSGWTITGVGTNVTLGVPLSYSGTFTEESGATLKLTSSNYLTLSNATIDGAVTGGSGTEIVLASGGTLRIGDLASVASDIKFSGSGDQLQIAGTTMPSGTILGFAPGDKIDLTSITFDSAGSATVGANNQLRITEGGSTYTLQLDQSKSFSNETFHLTSDSTGGTIITVSAQNDYNGDGTGDVLFQNDRTGQLSFVEMKDGASVGTGLATGSVPGLVYGGHGDINGDGRADIVEQDPRSGKIFVGYQDGSGNGVPNWAALPITTPGWRAKGVTDINGDGDGDVVLQNQTTDAVEYYDVHDAKLVAVTTVAGFDVVGLGDINGDGYADILMQNPSTGQIEYFNMAGGVFSGTVSVVSTPGWDVRAVGDLNGDGYADIAIQSEASGKTLFADMHGGSFSGWGTATSPLSTDYVVEDAVDVNKDGFADLIVQQKSTGATYYAQEGSTGFVQWGVVTSGLDAHSSVAGNTGGVPHIAALTSDYNGDGTGDVLFRNDQTGQLSFVKMKDGASVGTGVATGGLPGLVYGGHGDINGDGYADIVEQDPSSGAIYVGYQNGSGVPSWAVPTKVPGWSADGVADLNGDGYADIVIQNQTTDAVDYYDVHNAKLVAVTTVAGFDVVGLGDFNGDGYADILMQNPTTGKIEYFNMAKGTFSGVVPVISTPGWDVRAVGDLTGDGSADIVVQSRSSGQTLFADMHGGTFGGWGTATGPLSTDYVVEDAVDVFNNGHADVIVQQKSTGATYYAQEGSNGFIQWGTVPNSLGTHGHVV